MKQRLVAMIRRDKDGSWLITFPDVRGAHTCGRSLNQLRRRIPEVLRLWDRDPVRVDIVEVLELPANLKRAISIATRQRREAAEWTRTAQRDLEKTVQWLQSQLQVGVRHTGELLGISPQYAHKLRRARSRSCGVSTGRSARLPQ